MDPIEWAAPLIAALARGRVLDAGCGDGRFLPPGGIGLDRDLERLAHARKMSALLVCGDAHALPFADGTFDTVFANRMLNAAGRIDHALGELARVLRLDGALVVLTRARARPDEDRLDPANGVARLGRFFATVNVERAADAALFVARTKRGR
ncbi:MAG TPA: class I SAM-dependent methyltransferase [Candidatus Limnocylindria bacterium]|nr:class I SAM-dependent methyltransferase [Candidatus Limnocylindria bacterium]